VALARTAAGDGQGAALGSLGDEARALERLRTLDADLAARRARLNALVGRDADAPLAPPAALPSPRLLAADEIVLAAGVRNNPELAALAHDAGARGAAVAAARQEFIPDVNPFVGIEGGMAQIVGMAVSLPARITMIRAQIKEAHAMEDRAAALQAQGRRDLAAEFVETLAMLRAAERRTLLYDTRIVPLATQLTASARAAYEGGRLELPMLIEAEQGQLEARAMLAEARMERERNLAKLEALGGFDAETLATDHEEQPS